MRRCDRSLGPLQALVGGTNGPRGFRHTGPVVKVPDYDADVVVVEADQVVSATVVVTVGSRTKPHFLPFEFGAGFIGFFFALCVLQGLLWLLGTPPSSAELRTGKAAAIPRQVANTASFRVLTFTCLPPWLVGSPTPASDVSLPGGTVNFGRPRRLLEQADLAKD